MTPRLNQLLSDAIHTGEPPLHEVEEEMDLAEAAGQVGWWERLCSFVAWVFRKPSAGDA